MNLNGFYKKCILAAVLSVWCGAAMAQTPTSAQINQATAGMGAADIEKLKSGGFDNANPVSSSAVGVKFQTGQDRSRTGADNVINLLNVDPNTRYMLNNRGELVVDELFTAHNQRRVFGRDLFTTKNLSFIPNLNVATPVDYKLSAGDEVIIDVWGNAEANYRLTITPEGVVILPGVGPVQLNGLTISEAEAKIKSQLGKIMGGGSKMKLTLGHIRSIRVNVVGEAAMPGTYEMPSLTALFNVLYSAGGVGEVGSLRDIKVFRGSRKIADLDAYSFIFDGDKSQNIRMEDNDIIVVEPCRNMVYMLGALRRNMVFEMVPGETLADAIKYAGGFNGDAYTGSITIYRKDGDMYHVLNVGPDKFASMQMRDNDVAVVGSGVAKFANKVIIQGAVWRPGSFELSDTIRSLSSLIAAAGGLRLDAFLNRGYLIRVDDGFTSSVIAFDVKKAADGQVNIDLKPDDRVMISAISDISEFPTVAVYGEVNLHNVKAPTRLGDLSDTTGFNGGQPFAAAENQKNSPGNPYYDAFNYSTRDIYTDFLKTKFKAASSTAVRSDDNVPGDITVNILPYRANMSIADAIMMSGGLKESASEAKLIVYRRIHDPKATAIPENTARQFEFSISKDLSLGDDASKFILEPFDEVYVRRSPAYIAQQRVNVTGEVLFPGDYVLVKRNERLSDVIKSAGGINASAYVKGATITRTKNADELRRDEVTINAGRRRRNKLDSLYFQPSPTYSIGIDLAAALKKPGSGADVVLREGDVISVPKEVSTVRISGAVAYPTSISYSSRRAKYYINNAGGYSQDARRRPFVVYMNGKVMPARKARVEPGCEVVVPTKVYDPNKPQFINAAMVTALATAGFVIVTAVNNLK